MFACVCAWRDSMQRANELRPRRTARPRRDRRCCRGVVVSAAMRARRRHTRCQGTRRAGSCSSPHRTARRLLGSRCRRASRALDLLGDVAGTNRGTTHHRCRLSPPDARAARRRVSRRRVAAAARPTCFASGQLAVTPSHTSLRSHAPAAARSFSAPRRRAPRRPALARQTTPALPCAARRRSTRAVAAARRPQTRSRRRRRPATTATCARRTVRGGGGGGASRRLTDDADLCNGHGSCAGTWTCQWFARRRLRSQCSGDGDARAARVATA